MFDWNTWKRLLVCEQTSCGLLSVLYIKSRFGIKKPIAVEMQYNTSNQPTNHKMFVELRQKNVKLKLKRV